MKNRWQFQTTIKEGKRYEFGPTTIYVMPKRGMDSSNIVLVGVTLSVRGGKSTSVLRNRIKRLLRQAIRQLELSHYAEWPISAIESMVVIHKITTGKRQSPALRSNSAARSAPIRRSCDIHLADVFVPIHKTVTGMSL